MENNRQNRNIKIKKIETEHQHPSLPLELPLEIVLEEEKFYNAAATLLNEKIKRYEKKYSKTLPTKIFAMAAYDVIVCLMRYCNPLEATDSAQEFSSCNENFE